MEDLSEDGPQRLVKQQPDEEEVVDLKMAEQPKIQVSFDGFDRAEVTQMTEQCKTLGVAIASSLPSKLNAKFHNASTQTIVISKEGAYRVPPQFKEG